jgi:hypothetical protein
MLTAALAVAVAYTPSIAFAHNCVRREHAATKPDEAACRKLGPPVRMRGVWIRDFEGSRFVENVKTVEAARKAKVIAWLDDGRLLSGETLPLTYGYGDAYEIEITGRRAPKAKPGPPSGYGHMNMSARLVVIDRIVRYRLLMKPSTSFDSLR